MPMVRCWVLRLAWLLLANGLDMDFGDPSQEPRATYDIALPGQQQPTTAELQAFDCDAGLSEWRIVWGADKKRWCCIHMNRGCPGPWAPAPAPLPFSSGLRGREPFNSGASPAVAPPPSIADPGPDSEEYDAYNQGMTEGKVGEYVMKYLGKHPRQVKGISKKVLDDVAKMLQEQFHDFHKSSGAPVQTAPADEASEEPRHQARGLLLVLVGAMVGLTCSAILCLGMACGMWWARKLQAVPTQDPLLRTDGGTVTESVGPHGEEQSMVALEEAE
eukprot:TRINITY_DN19430_c0_g1_i1.p1 TRINITY_DN19430_c0_g1~~TRINITY_DN19430_c0_g1_i1.p1  ORF type:complete len:274 (-),score=59.46 TRINITY_DN19430_c0_g1_i1:128-949(-)